MTTAGNPTSTNNTTCPSCGYCPACGQRRMFTYPDWTYRPWYGPYWYYQPNVGGGVTGSAVNTMCFSNTPSESGN